MTNTALLHRGISTPLQNISTFSNAWNKALQHFVIGIKLEKYGCTWKCLALSTSSSGSVGVCLLGKSSSLLAQTFLIPLKLKSPHFCHFWSSKVFVVLASSLFLPGTSLVCLFHFPSLYLWKLWNLDMFSRAAYMGYVAYLGILFH